MGAVGKMSDSLGVNQSKPVEATEVDDLTGDVAAFFDQHEAVYPLYELFCEKLLVEFPDTRVKVQKSQISYYNRHLYACVSFLKVRKRAELPEDYFVLTLGLPVPLESGRVAAKTEPYPGRWTTHFVISDPSDLDEGMFGWVAQAYWFAQGEVGHGLVYPLMHQASSHFSSEQPGWASPVSVGARLVSGAASVIPLPCPISPPGTCAGETP